MKQYELSMIFNKRPETLERILRVVRHRGYDVIDLKVKLMKIKLIYSFVFRVKERWNC